MGISYSVAAGYGIVVKGKDNIARLSELLSEDGEELMWSELVAELLVQDGIDGSELLYGYEDNMSSGTDHAGFWVASQQNVFFTADEMYELEKNSGVHAVDVVLQHDGVDDVRRWLDDHEIPYEGPTIFYGVNVG